MTVAELIDQLKDMPQDAEVTKRSRGFFGYAQPILAVQLKTQTRRTGTTGSWLYDDTPVSGFDERQAVSLTFGVIE